MMKSRQRVGFWTIALFLCLAVSAHGATRLQKKDDFLYKKAVEIPADLLVQSILLTPNPNEGEMIGQPARFQIVVKNGAKGLAPKSTIRLQCSIENSSTKLCPSELSGLLNLAELSAGEILTLQWPKSSRSLWVAGNYTLSVEVDPQNSVPESNERNNTKTFRFSVGKSRMSPIATDKKVGQTDLADKMHAKDQIGKKEQPAIPVINDRNTAIGKIQKIDTKPSPEVVTMEAAPMLERSKMIVTSPSEDDCRIYAKNAVDQFLQAEKNMCDFQGSGWQNDPQKHFDWCMTASPDQRKQESDNRKAALQGCGEFKRFDKPVYLGMPVDFCMYRRTETHSTTPIEGELYDYDFGWMCGEPAVAKSYCISQGYEKMVEFKVADNKSTHDTMPLGNAHKCDASILLSNCRGFDFISCRKPVGDTLKITIKPQSQGATAAAVQEINVSFESTASACQAYAEESVRQYHQATSSWCTLGKVFDPAAWHGDLTLHYNWCLTATPGQRQVEIDNRNARLSECDKTERKRFDKPVYNGIRVDTFLNFREKYKGEPDVPQRAADAFCHLMGYEKAIREWFLYNTTFSTESLERTIHMGDDFHECNTDWPYFNDKCEAFSHITCERPSVP